MDASNDPPLDEIQWRSPPLVANMGGLHSNTVLFYFAESPFFERTSNNAIITNQAMNNMSMYHLIQTREAFEGRLRDMSGLEFIVGEEPAETGPGMGTGVWVVRKQTRRKMDGLEDEITVHASYFVVGENIYMAPMLADILAARIMTISSAIAKALPAAESARTWRSSMGHVYHNPAANQPSARPKEQESAVGTPMPGAAISKPATGPPKLEETSLERAAEEAFMIHMRYGSEYVDENPITGRPGEFHLSSTGRKQPVLPPAAGTQKAGGLGAMSGPTINTNVGGGTGGDKKDGKGEKTPKSATALKAKRKKSKMSTTPAAS